MRKFTFPSDAILYLDFEGHVSDPILRLIESEIDKYQAVFGITVLLGKAVAGEPAWIIEYSEMTDAPSLRWLPEKFRVVSTVKNQHQVLDSLSLLHTLAHSAQNIVVYTKPHSVEEAVNFLITECEETYPYFRLRGINWQQQCAAARKNRPTTWDDFSFLGKKARCNVGR